MLNGQTSMLDTNHQSQDETRHCDEWRSHDDSETPLMMDVFDDSDDDAEPNLTSEAALVRRLDKRLMTFAMLGSLVKSLDGNNLASAFISGMEEELNISGLQYNWMGVFFIVGYLTMQIPSNMLLSRIRPSIYLPSLELIWCILTLSMAFVTTVHSVYVIRLLLGLAEAGFYPGAVFLVGTWYTKHELGKRLALMTVCSTFGSGLSGVIQAVMLKTLDGVMGVSGWRWMFVFDALLTGVMALYGLKYLPDYPHNTLWLSNAERRIALQRLDANAENRPVLDLTNGPSVLRRMLRNKYIYLFVISWASVHLALGAPSVLGIVAKKLGFDSVKANLLTTPCIMLTMFAALCNGFISDRLNSRFWCILCPAFFALFGSCLLSLFVHPFALLYIGFIFTHLGLSSGTSIIMTWASETMAHDTQVRALTVATMNTSSSLMWVWAPLVLWPVTDAPRYQRGFTVSTCLIALFITSISITAFLHRKDCLSELNKGEKLNDNCELSALEKEELLSSSSSSSSSSLHTSSLTHV